MGNKQQFVRIMQKQDETHRRRFWVEMQVFDSLFSSAYKAYFLHYAIKYHIDVK